MLPSALHHVCHLWIFAQTGSPPRLQHLAVMPGSPCITSCCEIADSVVQPPCRQSLWGWPEAS